VFIFPSPGEDALFLRASRYFDLTLFGRLCVYSAPTVASVVEAENTKPPG
jgi:hypothetical protein